MARDKWLILTGNEAIALAAVESGIKVATSYPGTPATEILETIKKISEEKKLDIHASFEVNEKVAAEVAIAASVFGFRSICSMKQVGLNVAADPFVNFSYIEPEGGFVLVTADEPAIISSQTAQDNRWYSILSNCILVEPATVQEAYDFMKKSFELSEKYKLPVLFRITTRIAHTSSKVFVDNEFKAIVKKDVNINPKEKSLIPVYSQKLQERVYKKINLLRSDKVLNEFNKMTISNTSKIAFITSSVPYAVLMDLVNEYNLDISILKLGLTYPINKGYVANFLKMLDSDVEIFVLEESSKFLYSQILEIAGDRKINSMTEEFYISEIDSIKLIKFLARYFPHVKVEEKVDIELEIPKRLPKLCPGCPYRLLYYHLSRKVKNFYKAGDIGCYGLAALEPYNLMDTILCMGASFSFQSVYNTFISDEAIGIIGDSTFLHSGLTALISAIDNDRKFKMILLDNSTTAMTGGQDNPSLKIDIAKLIENLGVKVIHVNAFDLEDIKEKVKEFLQEKRAILYLKEKCATRFRIKDIPLQINHDICINCKKCLQVACPAIENTDRDKKPVIIENFCTGCSACAQVCPVNAINKKN